MAELINIPTYSDDRGALTVIDGLLPFDIKRSYYIYDLLKEKPRGGHRHKVSQQFLISVSGACEVYCDNGYDKKTFLLDKPDVGLLIQPEDWHVMKNFEEGTILLAFLSTSHDKEDYICEPIKLS